MNDTGSRIAETLLEALSWAEAAELVVSRIDRAVLDEDMTAGLHWMQVLTALVEMG